MSISISWLDLKPPIVNAVKQFLHLYFQSVFVFTKYFAIYQGNMFLFSIFLVVIGCCPFFVFWFQICLNGRVLEPLSTNVFAHDSMVLHYHFAWGGGGGGRKFNILKKLPGFGPGS